ncbi:hypothetical protein FBU59_002475 [Linderina macrospora]|uniref:Uncharacterized protein n=1 Tax=Linderina macrospora TaxID=4868 RepID=A0ACC1JB18_9FUNG|nr:hypothetical protein FBU59_002475 [Linderina macrospora]
MSLESEEYGIVVTGLQKQVDELRQMLEDENSQAEVSTTASAESAAQIKQLEDKNRKLAVRISHLLRALDRKDSELQALQQN